MKRPLAKTKKEIEAKKNDDVESSESEDISESEVEPAVTDSRMFGGLIKNTVQNTGTKKVQELEVDRPLSARLQTFKIRAILGIGMISAFLTIILAGHFYASILVIALTIGIYNEIIRIKRDVEKDKRLPFFFILRWYFFGITVLIAVTRWLSITRPTLQKYLDSKGLISYSAVLLGVILFTLSLRQFSLRYQFQQLAWVVTANTIIVVQLMTQIVNIYSGLFWFFLPSSLVILNDIFAYIFGSFFGKHRLIALSPKKTWEGFIGASIVTVLYGLLFTYIYKDTPQMICPEQELIVKPFYYLNHLRCDPPAFLQQKQFIIPSSLQSFIPISHLNYQPIMIHALVLSVFASIIAPFGGFFASGFKRAFKIKDFGTTIPGHGGITDRFDCQILMGMFTFLYINAFVSPPSLNQVENVYQTIISHLHLLTNDQKAHIVKLLTNSP